MSACQPGVEQATDDKATAALEKELAETKAELNRLKQDAVTEISKTAKAATKAKTARNEIADVDDNAESEIEDREKLSDNHPSLCWRDYCPCEKSPDYGHADIMLCRNLRAGLAVDDQIMSVGAGSRDARKSLREFNENEGTNW